MTNENLPPLPEADHVFDVALGAAVFTENGYTAAQMREYALEAIAESEAESLPAAWIAGKKAGLLEASKPVHRGVDAGDSGGLLYSPWLPIDSAPLSDPLVVWQGGDWVLAECSEYRGWCDLQGFELDPQPTHYIPIPPLPEPNP